MASWNSMNPPREYDVEPPEDWNGDIMGRLIYCPHCGKQSPVVKINPPHRNSPDPTETYTLKCGHTVL